MNRTDPSKASMEEAIAAVRDSRNLVLKRITFITAGNWNCEKMAQEIPG